MSFDPLPKKLEEGVSRFAEEQHISHGEAVLRLIESGLKSSNPRARIRGLSGKPMSDEDAKIVDEALAISMEARRERSRRILGA